MYNSRAIIIFLALLATTASQELPIKVHQEWTHANYTWRCPKVYENSVNNGSYAPARNQISGIKIWKDRLYLTIPRLRCGVPATLLSVSLHDENKSPLLEPYPNWDMQRPGDCSAFQFVQSMEIDPLGRMWVIDNGRSKINNPNPDNSCPPRLLILDLERKGEIVMVYTFPEDVSNRKSVFLNDIVVDHEDGGWAYVTDSDSSDPAIVVFSLGDRKSWRVRDDSMKPDEKVSELTVNGTTLTGMKAAVNGIALSPASGVGSRIVYFSALSSKEIFAVPTSALKSEKSDVKDSIRLVGTKPSQTDGMTMAANGVLYFGLLADDAVGMWDTKMAPFDKNQGILAQNHELMQWPNSFAFDGDGKLWFVSTRMQNFIADAVKVGETRFRVIAVDVGSKGYQYYRDGSVPPMPVISNN